MCAPVCAFIRLALCVYVCVCVCVCMFVNGLWFRFTLCLRVSYEILWKLTLIALKEPFALEMVR